jgi:hypothetical protein
MNSFNWRWNSSGEGGPLQGRVCIRVGQLKPPAENGNAASRENNRGDEAAGKELTMNNEQ